MKTYFLSILPFLFFLVSADDDICNLVNVSSVENGDDIISNGILQKSFDTRITLKEDLNYIPYEK